MRFFLVRVEVAVWFSKESSSLLGDTFLLLMSGGWIVLLVKEIRGSLALLTVFQKTFPLSFLPKIRRENLRLTFLKAHRSGGDI